MLARFSLGGAVLLLAACHGGSGGSDDILGSFTLLTAGNPGGEDDDPSVALDADGSVHVVWFSDRDGTKDLYYLRSDGIDLVRATITWEPIVRVTDLDPLDFPPPTQGDNYPALIVDADGMVNIAWHRRNLSNEAHIQFVRSDGTQAGFDAATTVDVTTGANFDRFPSLVRFAPDDLRIYFGSSTRQTAGVNDAFVCLSGDDGATWSAPAAVDGLNSFTEQTQFPTVVKCSDTSYLAVLQRWDLAGSGDVFDVTSDIDYAESTDGLAWTVEPVSIDAADDQVDFAPGLFFDHAGAAHLAWATVAFGDPTADLVTIPAAQRASYPAAAHLIDPQLGVPDHSPRILAATVDGRRVFLEFWVRILNGHNQVGYRIRSNL